MPNDFYKHATVYAGLQPSSRNVHTHTHTQIHNSAATMTVIRVEMRQIQKHWEAVENILG